MPRQAVANAAEKVAEQQKNYLAALPRFKGRSLTTISIKSPGAGVLAAIQASLQESSKNYDVSEISGNGQGKLFYAGRVIV